MSGIATLPHEVSGCRTDFLTLGAARGGAYGRVAARVGMSSLCGGSAIVVSSGHVLLAVAAQ